MFSFSKCGSCGGSSFALAEVEPTGSRVKLHIVQCGSCKVPIGVVDFYPNSTVINKIAKLQKDIDGIESKLSVIEQLLRRLK